MKTKSECMDRVTRSNNKWRDVFSKLAPRLNYALSQPGKHVPCPVHGGKDGFRLYPNFQNVGAGVCNTCGDFKNGIDLLMWVNKWTKEVAIKEISNLYKTQTTLSGNVKNQQENNAHGKEFDDEHKKLVKILDASIDDDGRIGNYLKSRGLSDQVPNSLKLHKNLKYWDTDEEKPILMGNFPAMISPLGKKKDLVGLHITYIDINGNCKAKVKTPKKIRSCVENLSGAALQLFSADPKKPLVVGEGIENMLAVHEAIGLPVWACGNAILLEKVKIPKDINTVYIAADLDKSNRGQNAAEILAARVHKEGKTVYIVIPNVSVPDGKKGVDWLDLLNEQGAIIVKKCFDNVGPWEPITIRKIMEKANISKLNENSTPEEIFTAINNLPPLISDMDRLKKMLLKSELINKLKDLKVQGPAQLAGDVINLKEVENEGTKKNETCSMIFETVAPWPEEVDGSRLLRELVTTLNRYVIFNKNAPITIALWTLHAWAIEAFYLSPLLGLKSPQMRCGKSTALTVIQHLSPRSLLASNITPPAVFRSIEKYSPTLFMDECDTFLKDNPELNGIINAGHTRDTAYVIRCVGDNHDPVLFHVFCAKILAFIGRQRNTIEDRSIAVGMERKKKSEKVEKLRTDHLRNEFQLLRQKCARWAQDNIDILKSYEPTDIESLKDRAADNWRPLLAIAEICGSEWAEKARVAALQISGEENIEDDSFATQLLEDFRDYFKKNSVKSVFTASLLNYLHQIEERPWSDFKKGKQITPRQVARLLKDFKIKPKQIRIGAESNKGYLLSDFKEIFIRYLGEPDVSNETAKQSFENRRLQEYQKETEETDVSDEKLIKPFKNNNVSDVSDKSDELEKNNNLIGAVGGSETLKKILKKLAE